MTAMIAQMSIPPIHRIVSFVLAAAVAGATVELIRRRKLREEYALLWFGTSVVLLAMAIFPSVPFRLSRWLGINYVTLMVMVCFLFLGMIVLHFATVITHQSEQIRCLAERMAIMRQQLEHPASGDKESPDGADDR